MILGGLTGGIGSGKSTVAGMLAERGAVIIDADAITRELQEPGQPVYEAIVKRFGPEIVNAEARLERAKLAGIVFGNPANSGDTAAKRDLEAIVWPAVGAETARRIEAERNTDHVVVYDVPLLVETGRRRFLVVVVVDVEPEVAVARLVKGRGMDEADARARISQQASREDRLALADFIVDNSGSFDDLTRQVDDLWGWLRSLPQPDTERMFRS